MPPLLRLRALNGKTKILLGIVLGLAVLVVLFDWNWLRGPFERYLSEQSGRDVRIGHLDVDLGFSLMPTVRLRDVHIPNAPWGSERPLVTARELAITFSIRSVLQKRPVISRMVLADATVSLERQADGLRNWRIRNPMNRGPGRTRVWVLEAHRSQISFVNQANDLELVTVSGPLEVKAGDERFTTRITFKGSYQGASFTGEAQNGGVISFRESGLAFPLRGHLLSRGTRLEVDGQFTDVFDLGPMDTAIRLSGPSLAQLHPFLRIHPPASRRYDVKAHLVQKNDVYTFSKLGGKIGETDIAGMAVYDRSGERPSVRAELSSASAHLADLRPLVGLQAETPSSVREGNTKSERVFSTQPFNMEKLRSLDVQVKLDAKKLASTEAPMLDSLRLEARLDDGVLEVKPLDLGFAGGRIAGSVNFDGRAQPPSSRTALELRDIRIERLFPVLAEKARGAGAIRGRIDLAGRGNSLAAILGSTNGAFAAKMEGGRMSSLANAKLGLDFGKVLRTFVLGERDHAIHCVSAAFEVRNAIAKSQNIVLDAEETHVNGAGTINLGQEKLDVLFTPHPRKPGLFARRSSIRVHGLFSSLSVSIDDAIGHVRGPAPTGCAA